MKLPATLLCRLLAPATLAGLSFMLTACESTQGPAPTINQHAGPVGTQGREIEPAPESKSYPTKKDVFQAAEYDPGVGLAPAGSKQIRLRVGEIVEVFKGSAAIGDGQYELAFYLPVEARSVVQLVAETKGLTRTYFLKAIGQGDTVGGVVERRWLDSDGYSPKDTAAEARIQDAVRKAPYLISVN